jgi:hypothetical protein
MTQQPDDDNPSDPPEGRSGEVGGKLDEDAAWRDIVAHFADSPTGPLPPAEMDEPGRPATEPAEPAEPAERPARPPVLEPRWRDGLNSPASWDEEGHFVPPEPPPLPAVEPRRRLAWIGMFGSPLVMVAFVVLGWGLPGIAIGTLVLAFVGGFGYLVATMPRKRPGEESGDDGAVV